MPVNCCFAFLGDVGVAIRSYPVNPRSYDAQVKIIALGTLTMQQYELLVETFSTTCNFVFFDELREPSLQLLAETRIRKWEELPHDVAIPLELRDAHKAVQKIRLNAMTPIQTDEYIGFVFDSAGDADHREQVLGIGTKVIARTDTLTDKQILYFCNTVKIAVNTGELTGEQFTYFCSEFQSRYTGMKCVLFIPKQSIPADNGLKSKLLRDKIEKLFAPTYVSAGRERAVNAVIEIANEIRILDDCGHKNIEVGQPMRWDVDNEPAYRPKPSTAIPPWKSITSSAPPVVSAVPPVIVSESLKAPIEEWSDPFPQMYYAAKTDTSEPREVAIVEVDPDAKQAMMQAHYEAGLLLKYADEVDEWHIISKTKYNGKGWADIANKNETERIAKGNKPRTKQQMENYIERIRRSVEAHREKLGITRE